MTFKENLFEVVFGTETKAGKLFDIILLWVILLSITTVILESVGSIRITFSNELEIAEWVFTFLFTIEYFLRIYISPKPKKYIFSFFGIVDLLATLPSYLTFILPTGQFLLIVRVLRLLRIFRVLKLGRHLKEGQIIISALQQSFYKITVFFGAVFTLVIILGTLMYMIEGEEHGFSSIPMSIYWSIVTITTVGYGDITPQTIMGKALSSFIMLLGYTIIAVPTGIITVELNKENKKDNPTHSALCKNCNSTINKGAKFCSNCGEKVLN